MTDVTQLAAWLRAIGDAEPHTPADCFPGYEGARCTCDQAERASLAQAKVVMDAIHAAIEGMEDEIHEGLADEAKTISNAAMCVIERAAKEKV